MASTELVFRLLGVDVSAGRVIEQLGDKAYKASAQVDKLDKIGNKAALAGGILAAGVGLAVKSFADFDQAMSNVSAATHASSGEMDALRKAALQAGKDTQFSATGAAEAVEALAKAGISTSDILGGGLSGALSLAAAGSLSVGEAAESAASALTQFSLTGKDVGHVADLLAAGAGKAQGSVHDMSAALQMSGSVAAQMGLSLEDSVGALAEFASAGLTGSDAGTSFKQMLLSLNPQSKQAADMMTQLGLSFYNSQGQLKTFPQIAEELRSKLSGLSAETQATALKTIFGADAYRVAAIAMKGGGESAAEWVGKVNDAGYAAETARLKMDNLSGDLEQLKGSLDTALIQTGSGANGALRGLVQTANEAIGVFLSLPAPIQQGTLVLTAFAAAGLLAFAGVAKAVSSFSELVELGVIGKLKSAGTAVVGFAQNLGSIVTGSARAEAGMGKMIARGIGFGVMGAAIGVATIALDMWAKKQQEAAQRAAELKSAIEADSGALGENTRAQISNTLEQDGVLKAAQKLGIGLGDLENAILGNKDAYAQVSGALQQYNTDSAATAQSGARSVRPLNENERAALQLKNALHDTSGELQDQVGAYKRTEAASNGLTGATTSTTDASKSLAAQSRDLATAQDRLKGAQDALNHVFDKNPLLVMRNAENSYQASVDAVTKALKDNGKTLDVHTEKGRSNREALDAEATASQTYLQTVLDQQGPGKVFSQTLATQEGNLVKAATQFGMSKAAAKAYAEKVLGIPAAKATKVSASVVDASAKIAALQRQINELKDKNVKVTTTVWSIFGNKQVPALSPQLEHRASGGPVAPGPAYIVGEEGPELVTFAGHGMVMSHNDTRHAMRGGTLRMHAMHAEKMTALGRSVIDSVEVGLRSRAPAVLNFLESFAQRISNIRVTAGVKHNLGKLVTDTAADMRAATANFDRIADAIKDQRKKVADLIKARADYANQLASGASGGGITNIGLLKLDDQGRNADAQQKLSDAQNVATNATQKLADAKQKLADLSEREAGRETKLTDAVVAARQRLADLDAQAAARTTQTIAQLQALRNARDAVTAAEVKAAEGDASTISQLQALRDARQEVTDAEAAAADASTKLGTAQDVAKTATTNQATDYLDQLKARADAIKSFAGNMSKLKAEGLSQNVLQQIAQAGLETGGALAQALATQGTPETIKGINAMSKRINDSSKAFGKTWAGQMYDSGIDAAEGLLKGLKSREATLQKAVRAIAQAMVDEIKRTLKIKSPSGVMRDEVGAMIPAGLVAGINSGAGGVSAAMSSLVRIPAVGVPSAGWRPFAGGGGDTHVHLHMPNGFVGSPDQLATALSDVISRAKARGLNLSFA